MWLRLGALALFQLSLMQFMSPLPEPITCSCCYSSDKSCPVSWTRVTLQPFGTDRVQPLQEQTYSFPKQDPRLLFNCELTCSSLSLDFVLLKGRHSYLELHGGSKPSPPTAPSAFANEELLTPRAVLF